MVEVKEPFIAERVAAGPARFPLLAVPQTPALLGTAQLVPGHSPARPRAQPCPSPAARGSATHDARSSPQSGLRAPRTGAGGRGDEFVGRCCSLLSPAPGAWGREDGGGRHCRRLFAVQVALFSDGRARCELLPRQPHCRAPERVGKAVPTPPIRSDAEGRALAWEGAPVPTGRQ